MFNLKIIYTMRLTKGFNFHPTSLEFVADDSRDYRAELPPHLSELGLPKDVARLVYFRLKSRNGNELTFLGDFGYSREYHCKVLKSPTTGKEICYVTFRGEPLLLEASVYIHAGKPVADFELDKVVSQMVAPCANTLQMSKRKRENINAVTTTNKLSLW